MRTPLNLVILSALLTSCATVTAGRAFQAQMLNLSTGEVAACVFQAAPMGHSTIKIGPTKSGETFTGEASEIDNQVHSSPYGSASAFTSGAYADTYLAASRDRDATPGYKSEHATLIGTRGTIVNIQYRIGPSGDGDGEGWDNNGVKYRLKFSQQ